jgi:hypothetical protein
MAIYLFLHLFLYYDFLYVYLCDSVIPRQCGQPSYGYILEQDIDSVESVCVVAVFRVSQLISVQAEEELEQKMFIMGIIGTNRKKLFRGKRNDFGG